MISGASQELRVWHVGSGRCLQDFQTMPYILTCMSVAPDGVLACGDLCGQISLWWDPRPRMEKRFAREVARTRACGDVAELVAKFL